MKRDVSRVAMKARSLLIPALLALGCAESEDMNAYSGGSGGGPADSAAGAAGAPDDAGTDAVSEASQTAGASDAGADTGVDAPEEAADANVEDVVADAGDAETDSGDAGQDADGCVDACSQGEQTCESNGLRSCEVPVSGCNVWGAPVPCEPGEECQVDTCVKTCVDECTSSQTTCDGSNLSTCEQQGVCWVWGTPQPCPSNETCVGTSCVAEGPIDADVQIYIDNFCNVSVVPDHFDVATGDTLQLTYHNNSVDYEADLWASYGGGYLQLPQGGTWADQFEWCTMPGDYTGYMDVNIWGGPFPSCPGVRLYIYCH